MRKEIIGDCTLYLGDCLDIMPTLGKVDAVVTDPPYGIGRDKGFGGLVGFGGAGIKIARKEYRGSWDDVRPEKQCFDLILSVSDFVLIFGGNYFADILPLSTHWIVWDKMNTMPTFGDCELAWTNSDRKSVKKVTIEYNGLLGKEKQRQHATQKPLKLMSWCILNYSKGDQTILDPFMGSGTTGVACVELGRKFIGVEIDEKYFDIACERISRAERQGDLFRKPPGVQEGLALG